MTAFVDTFALIAWVNARDLHHRLVSSYLDSFTGHLVTTEWVLVEFADALSSPASRLTAARLVVALRNDPAFEVIEYQHDVYSSGFELFASRPDKAWSLTDCISFAVMADRGLTVALTADRHFEQAGFTAVFK